MFDCGTPSVTACAAQHEFFNYMESLGIANIGADGNRVMARLRKELPLECMTPLNSGTFIIIFRMKKPAEVSGKN